MNRILTSLKKLQRRFYNQPGFIQTREGMRELPGKHQQTLLVIGRGLCMYRYHDFSHVPKNRRDDALESSLGLWSPFEQTGWYCHWSSGFAMVWLWDKSGINEDALPDGSFSTLPETVFLSRTTQGCAKQYCEVGVELQSWDNTALIDSLWFGLEPNEHQVQKFCTQHACTPDSVWDHASKHSAEPWHQDLSPMEWLQKHERDLVISLVLVLGVFLVWQEVRIFKAGYQESMMEQRLLALENELTPVLVARSELDKLERRNSSLKRLVRMPSQARLMTLVSSVLPVKTALFREWHYQQGTLSFIVEDTEANPNTVDYVNALRAESLFKDVSAEQARGNNRIQISLRVQQP